MHTKHMFDGLKTDNNRFLGLFILMSTSLYFEILILRNKISST